MTAAWGMGTELHNTLHASNQMAHMTVDTIPAYARDVKRNIILICLPRVFADAIPRLPCAIFVLHIIDRPAGILP